MNKYIISVLFPVFFCFVAIAQNEVYLDTNQNKISLIGFNDHLLKSKMGWGFYILDSTYYYVPSKSYKLGKLTSEELKSVLNNLKEHGLSLNENQSVCIGYIGNPHYKFNHYDKIKLTKQGHFSDKETSRAYKFIDVSKDKLKAINFHGERLLKSEYYKELALTKIDSSGFMKKLFNLSYPCQSYMYLKPDGNYLIIYGISVHRPNFTKQIKSFIED